MVTDPERVKHIKKQIQKQKEIDSHERSQNRAKRKNYKKTYHGMAKNSKRKQSSNSPLKSDVRSEYEPGYLFSETGSRKDGVSKVRRYGLRYVPTSRPKIEELATEMVYWAHTTDSMQIEDFPILCGLSPKRFFGLADQNEYFEQCLDTAKHIMSSKIFHNVASGDIEKSLPSKVYPVYNERYRSYLSEQNKEQQTSAVQAIKIPAIPSEPEE